MYQLKNLMGRTNVKGKPIDSFNPCEDFFLVVIEAHILAAAMKMLKMSSVHDTPSAEFAPQGDETWAEVAEKRKAIVHISISLIDFFVHLGYKATSNGTVSAGSSEKSCDGVYSYATNFLSLGCFYLEFRDAIKEGDGLRVLRCYRYMLPMFISSGRTNYSIETLNLLLQHDFC